MTYSQNPIPDRPNYGQAKPLPMNDQSSHNPVLPQRRISPRSVVVLLFISALVLIVGAAYIMRNSEAHDIEATLIKWDKTWELAGNYEKNQLTCAKSQDLSAQTPSAPRAHDQENIDVYDGVTEISVSPLMNTAYAEATLTSTDLSRYDSRGNNVSRSFAAGFELVKENGSWKVCDWGSDVMKRHRTLLVGWKIQGPPKQ